MERLGKHVPAAKDMHAAIAMLETVFSTRAVQRGYIMRTPAWELSFQLKVRLLK
jgi:hypothetical protein